MVELLDGLELPPIDTDGEMYLEKSDAEYIADHLLKNGVIVPPCNVGDAVYILWPPNQDDAQIIRGEVIGFSFGMKDEVYISNINYCGCFCRPFSKVFVYREDAEQALREKNRECGM